MRAAEDNINIVKGIERTVTKKDGYKDDSSTEGVPSRKECVSTHTTSANRSTA